MGISTHHQCRIISYIVDYPENAIYHRPGWLRNTLYGQVRKIVRHMRWVTIHGLLKYRIHITIDTKMLNVTRWYFSESSRFPCCPNIFIKKEGAYRTSIRSFCCFTNITLWGWEFLCLCGIKLHLTCGFLIPGGTAIKEQSCNGADTPADGPCQPNTQAVMEQGGEYPCNGHTKHQIDDGGDDEFTHHAGASEDTVTGKLGSHDEIEGGQNPEELNAYGDGLALRILHKQSDQRTSAEAVQQNKGDAQNPRNFYAGTAAFSDTAKLVGTQILGGEVGNSVSEGGEGCNDQIVDFYRGTVSGHDAGAEGVDDALNHDVANGNKALLEHTGQCHDSDTAQQILGKQRGFFAGSEGAEPTEHYKHSKNTADALTQEGCPCHTVNTHFECGDKQDIHKNVRRRGNGQKDERSLGIAQSGEYAGCDVVEEHKGKTQKIDVEVELRICHNVVRGVDEAKQRSCAEETCQHQTATDNAAGDEGGVNGSFQLLELLGSKQLGHDDRAANVGAEGNGNKDEGQLVAVAHGSQSIFADEFACHQTVSNVIELLKNNTCKEGQTELPQNF